ncbi:hypothetical protein LNKW23_46750 [Paralimibaculum aggregatum]|uniref:Transglutaminase-like domain-containing protein n=1 Tax=Paralimibaculum aggregatum TaxID=3036245 RepID=A0ABQ6LTQ0_9RHOB|nr:transglutaminase-like domain-containing protein [Limibaculum sp. NKW23]GMG85455.1 hypothetical protein LNKW23_46750 [Limibaculum sp. NKW23]
MQRRVRVQIEEAAPPGAWAILPRPIAFWGQRFTGFAAAGVAEIREIGATNAGQRAYLLRPAGGAGAPLAIEYGFDMPANGAATLAPAEPWIWALPESRHVIADAGLRAQAADCTAGAADGPAKLRAIIAEAARLFAYDHPEARFTDGHAAVPALCGTTRGSCVDINTFVLAAALSQGIEGQYFAGYWFGPGRSTTPDMHCWLGFRAAGGADSPPEFWDVAHHLKWGVPALGPGLNPAGGRRVALSCGRGLAFDTPLGRAEISHFSEPLWVLPGGTLRTAPVRISLEEEHA